MAQKEMADALKSIAEKVEQLLVAQGKSEANQEHIKETLGLIKLDLGVHIKRTDLLEHEITKVRGFLFYFAVTVTTLAAATTVVANLWKVMH